MPICFAHAGHVAVGNNRNRCAICSYDMRLQLCRTPVAFAAYSLFEAHICLRYKAAQSTIIIAMLSHFCSLTAAYLCVTLWLCTTARAVSSCRSKSLITASPSALCRRSHHQALVIMMPTLALALLVFTASSFGVAVTAGS